jgi:hypothetical protein
MSFHDCIVCKRRYEFNDEIGYDRELCGPYCHGYLNGTKRPQATSATLYEVASTVEARARAMDDIDQPDTPEAEKCMDALRNAGRLLRTAAGWLVDAEHYSPTQQSNPVPVSDIPST